MLPRPLRSTLFPYTTLFRSLPSPFWERLDYKRVRDAATLDVDAHATRIQQRSDWGTHARDPASHWTIAADGLRFDPGRWRHARSEEHTSELQSRQYLVCRLL